MRKNCLHLRMRSRFVCDGERLDINAPMGIQPLRLPARSKLLGPLYQGRNPMLETTVHIYAYKRVDDWQCSLYIANSPCFNRLFDAHFLCHPYNKTSLARKLRRGDYVLQEFETEVRQRFKASNTSLSTSPVPDLMVVLTDALFLWRHDFAGSHWSLQKFVGSFIEKDWAKRMRGLIQSQSTFQPSNLIGWVSVY